MIYDNKGADLMRVFDMHCDTMTLINKKGLDLSNEQTAVSLPKAQLAKAEAYVQCFALFVKNDDSDEAEKEWAEHYEWFKNQMAKYSEKVEQAMTYDDILRITKAGKMAAILTTENAAAFGGRLDQILKMREKGCLISSLTWNGKNALAGGSQAQEYGLSDFGREAIIEMERCGMVVDVSHISDRAMNDFLKTARRPFIATHSNARAVCSHMRNLPDEYIKEIIRRKGLIGINYFKEFLRGSEYKRTKSAEEMQKMCAAEAGTAKSSEVLRTEEAGLDDIAKHIEHTLKLGGEKALALGSDYDGAEIPKEIDGIDKIGTLYTYLKARFGSEITDNIFFENAMNFFRINF